MIYLLKWTVCNAQAPPQVEDIVKVVMMNMVCDMDKRRCVGCEDYDTNEYRWVFAPVLKMSKLKWS